MIRRLLARYSIDAIRARRADKARRRNLLDRWPAGDLYGKDRP